MAVKGRIKSGEYFDSVTLMIVARDITAAAGVQDAAVVMATHENKAILRSSGLWLPEFDQAQDTDLVIAVKAADEAAASGVLASADERLKKVRNRAGTGQESRPASLEAAVKALPGANMAVISIAGRYAGDEARKALDAGLHVMLFSDNVPLETEISLKRYGQSKGLLVMGPDCGTAIINGVPLAFANAVSRGDIGIVAAAGTGLQEVSTLVSNQGAGISQAIGTGGRDVKEEVGGIMFLGGIQALAQDPATRIIVLISKPPHKSVLQKIGQRLQGLKKPVVAAFLGAGPEEVGAHGMTPASTLEEAAAWAVALSKGSSLEAAQKALVSRRQAIEERANADISSAAKTQRYARGLFSGGTFCTEAQLVFKTLKVKDVFSNVPLPPSAPIEDAWKSRQHTLIDLGEDAFTVGRPHPMIDYSLRNRRILDEAKDPETAVILLDVVIGHGANMDPVQELKPAIGQALALAKEGSRKLLFACSVTGTVLDPQDRSKVEAGLRDAGALVFESNAAAARFAACAAKRLETR